MYKKIIKFPAFKLILNVETRCYSSYGAIFRKFIISRLDAPNAARAPGYRRRGVVISKKKKIKNFAELAQTRWKSLKSFMQFAVCLNFKGLSILCV